MISLAAILLVFGALLMVIAAWGVVKLPDALTRQHAATKAGTLAITVIFIGAILAKLEWAWMYRLMITLCFLLMTLPVAAHLLARAAIRESSIRTETDISQKG